MYIVFDVVVKYICRVATVNTKAVLLLILSYIHLCMVLTAWYVCSSVIFSSIFINQCTVKIKCAYQTNGVLYGTVGVLITQ